MRATLILRIALVVFLFAPAGSAWSDEEGAGSSTPISQRWMPGFSVGLIISEDRVDGAIDSTIGAGFSDAGSLGTTVPRLQLGLDLSSPALRPLPLAPRVVALAGLQVMGPNEENQFAGTPNNVNLDLVREQVANARPNPITGEFPSPEGFRAQGSNATSEYRILGWYLGLGLVFEFPNRKDEDPALRLRPFVSYVGEQIHLKGGVVEVTGRPPSTPYVITEGLVSERDILHYVGPGLDAELVVASFPRTTFSLFATVSFLWNVGDASYTFSDSNGIATYDLEVDDFQIRPGGGIRMAWRGGP